MKYAIKVNEVKGEDSNLKAFVEWAGSTLMTVSLSAMSV